MAPLPQSLERVDGAALFHFVMKARQWLSNLLISAPDYFFFFLLSKPTRIVHVPANVTREPFFSGTGFPGSRRFLSTKVPL